MGKIISQFIMLYIVWGVIDCNEPICSKFPYEEQLLEKMIRTEFNVGKWVDEVKKEQHEVTKEFSRIQDIVLNELKSVEEDREYMKSLFANLKTDLLKEMKVLRGNMETSFKKKEDQIVRMSEDLQELFENITSQKSKEINACSSNCIHGTCDSVAKAYQCRCAPEFTGSKCDVALNLVLSGYLSVKQSSTTHGGAADRAVDGDLSNQWNDNSCTHTDSRRPSHWWALQLKQTYTIGRIVIINRGDCCDKELNSLDIYIDNTLCVHFDGPPEPGSSKLIELRCNDNTSLTGSLVNITKLTVGPLTLCEVSIFAK